VLLALEHLAKRLETQKTRGAKGNLGVGRRRRESWVRIYGVRIWEADLLDLDAVALAGDAPAGQCQGTDHQSAGQRHRHGHTRRRHPAQQPLAPHAAVTARRRPRLDTRAHNTAQPAVRPHPPTPSLPRPVHLLVKALPVALLPCPPSLHPKATLSRTISVEMNEPLPLKRRWGPRAPGQRHMPRPCLKMACLTVLCIFSLLSYTFPPRAVLRICSRTT
jgi:hypothetical protein